MAGKMENLISVCRKPWPDSHIQQSVKPSWNST